MLNKIYQYILLGAFLLIGGLFFYLHILSGKLEKSKDRASYYQNQSENISKIFKDKDSLWRIQSNALIISQEGLKKIIADHYSKLYAITQEFDVKAKNTLAINTTTVENRTVINVKIKDTIINHSDTIILIKYADKFVKINGIIKNDTLSAVIDYIDSLDQIVYQERKKILFLKIGKKSYKSEVRSSNPNTKITINKFLLIKR